MGHTLNTQMLMKTDDQKKVLSKFIILCWAAFIVMLDHELNIPARLNSMKLLVLVLKKVNVIIWFNPTEYIPLKLFWG